MNEADVVEGWRPELELVKLGCWGVGCLREC
jgi:hypothetical protein